MILISCNHKSEKLYQSLPIAKEFEGEYFIFDRGEISKEELHEMPNLTLVINSQDEFPQENLMGLKEIKESDIDFRKYTLLLAYFKFPGLILGCRYLYYKDLANDIINFQMKFRLDLDQNQNPEAENLFTYYRCAILVSKIPDDEEVAFSVTTF